MSFITTAILETTGEIDGKTTGTTEVSRIGGVGAVIPQAFYVALSNCAGTVLSTVTLSIGTNSPDYDNFVPATALPLLNQTNKLYAVVMTGMEQQVVNTDPEASISIMCKVRVAAIATTYTLSVTASTLMIQESV
ncbi:MAG TPA: hypothetical protein PLK06_00370 [bacterium]|nr:hypothetical protein [bacterium]